MEYRSPEYLHLLWFIALLLLVSIYAFIVRRRKMNKFFSSSMQDIVSPLSNPIRYLVRDFIILLSFSFMVISLARPIKVNMTKTSDSNKGIETIFCVDVSNSMLSQDVKPSRIDLVKNVIKVILESRPNDHVGIVVFAGSSYNLVPITPDLGIIMEFLKTVYPNMISDQGTNIESAISTAIKCFSSNDRSTKEIVILTDGENQYGNAESIAKEAKSKGIIVNVIGVGSESGGPIPINNNEYLKNENGQTVITKFNPDLCESIARSGGGVFITSSRSNEIASLLKSQMDKLPQSEMDPTIQNNYEEMYSSFLWISLCLLLFEFFVIERKNILLRKLNLFNREK